MALHGFLFGLHGFCHGIRHGFGDVFCDVFCDGFLNPPKGAGPAGGAPWSMFSTPKTTPETDPQSGPRTQPPKWTPYERCMGVVLPFKSGTGVHKQNIYQWSRPPAPSTPGLLTTSPSHHQPLTHHAFQDSSPPAPHILTQVTWRRCMLTEVHVFSARPIKVFHVCLR